jgi:hypothetical protein
MAFNFIGDFVTAGINLEMFHISGINTSLKNSKKPVPNYYGTGFSEMITF